MPSCFASQKPQNGNKKNSASISNNSFIRTFGNDTQTQNPVKGLWREINDSDYDIDEIVTSSLMRSKSPILQEFSDKMVENHACNCQKCSCDKLCSSSLIYCTEHPVKCMMHFPIPKHQQKFIPLHAALECSASYHVIQYILNHRYVEDVHECDERGMLPLHWAVVQCSRPQLDTPLERKAMISMIIEKLIVNKMEDGTFNAAMIRDYIYNRLPLHFALLYQADPQVIKALIEAYPSLAVDTCHTRDIFCDKTPLHIAIQMDCTLEITYMLLRLDPSFIANEQSITG
jgi:hypothetical protein